LGSLDTVSPFPATSPLVFATPFSGAITTHTRFTEGANKSGRPAPPLPLPHHHGAKACPKHLNPANGIAEIKRILVERQV
jgi:hypothetical protein